MKRLCSAALLLHLAFLSACSSSQSGGATTTTQSIVLPEMFQPKSSFSGFEEKQPFEEHKQPPDFSQVEVVAVGLQNEKVESADSQD